MPNLRAKALAAAIGEATTMVGSMFEPNEAEAMPVGKIVKGGTKAASEMAKRAGATSRTEAVLVGKALPAFDNKVIERVTKGRGDIRYIRFSNGSIIPVTKDVVGDLVREIGTKKYEAAFLAKPVGASASQEGSQLAQAFKSLDYHKKRILPGQTAAVMRDHFKYYKKNITDTGRTVPAMSLVKEPGTRTPFYMPTAYADLLEKEKVVIIMERFE